MDRRELLRLAAAGTALVTQMRDATAQAQRAARVAAGGQRHRSTASDRGRIDGTLQRLGLVVGAGGELDDTHCGAIGLSAVPSPENR